MAGSLKTLNIYQNGSSIYEASTFTSYGIWTDGNKIYKTNNHTPQSGDTELVTLTTAISGLYHNADGEQVNVGLNTVLVITTLAATDIIVYCLNASNKTTLDLSTLSDIADGTHTVKVKAKADGYIDSEFSNEVSYTKAPSGYQITLYAMGHVWKNQYGAPRLKLDAAPTSADDYDYTMTTDDTKNIMDKADTHRSTSMNIGAHTIIYVFSSNTSASAAYAKYNGQIFGSGKNYNNADIITLDGTSDRIDLYSEGQD